jgi:hypothetical protein
MLVTDNPDGPGFARCDPDSNKRKPNELNDRRMKPDQRSRPQREFESPPPTPKSLPVSVQTSANERVVTGPD